MIKCATSLRYRKKDAAEDDTPEVYSLKLQNITLLSNTTDYISELHISFPISRSDAAFRKHLLQILKKHKGSARLFVNVGYSFEDTPDTVTMFSKKYLVKPSYELLSALDSLGIPHKVVQKPVDKWF